ncbi:hypothetical protein Ssi03_37100 [Sphaerisporangium siamense]|nr:hypothetical protein Ssi03_37100 [Sphaerisporangium siamense]
MWLGVSIALVGALGYAGGAAIQQYEAVRGGATFKLVRRPRWWIGGAIGFAGASLHALALSFAPLVLVQPVSVTTLVFAVPLAAVLHGRRPHRAEILGSIAVSAGLLGIMLLVPQSHTRPELSTRGALWFLACIGVVVALCELFARRRARGTTAKALVTAIGAGAVTAAVSTFVRVVGGGLDGDLSRLFHWFTLVIPVLLVVAVILLQKSYAVGHFSVAYAGVQVIDPVTSVLAGVILLGEPVPTDPASIIPALISAAVLIGGTITLGRLSPDPSTLPCHVEAPVPVTTRAAAR